MNDFFEFVLSLFKRGMSLAISAVFICALAVALSVPIYKFLTKGKRSYPWKKAVLILVLIGYFSVLAYATLLRYGGVSAMRSLNLHFFRAWREAWNSFFFQNWMNIFINIAMFVPLGVLLPLFSKHFKKWYLTVPIGLALSLAIEVVQYYTGRGIMDVDDLFANFLGTVLGYCCVMTVITLFSKKKIPVHILAYSSFPLIFSLSMLSIFGAYHLKEYGNLADAPYFTADTKGIEWIAELELDDDIEFAHTYYREPFTKKTCDEFGEAFAEMLGIEFGDRYYYNSMTVFADHFNDGGFLDVYYNDRSYSYSASSNGSAAAVFGREDVLKMLERFEIDIPESADFTVDEYGNHIFTVDMFISGETLVDGKVTCKCLENGQLSYLDNALLVFEKYKEEEIISTAKAYSYLKEGKFSGGEIVENMNPNKIEVLSCELDYMVDTKGFYQPVYVFFLILDGDYELEAMVPAMK